MSGELFSSGDSHEGLGRQKKQRHQVMDAEKGWMSDKLLASRPHGITPGSDPLIPLITHPLLDLAGDTVCRYPQVWGSRRRGCRGGGVMA